MKEADQEADQDKPKIKGHNNVEQKLQENEKSTDAKEADQEADQGKPLNDETNITEEGIEKSTNATKEDQEEDQVNLPYQNRTNIEEELQGN